jgi:hypothetical protein
VDILARGYGSGFAAVPFLTVQPPIGTSASESITFDVRPNSVFEVHQQARAIPFCPPDKAPACGVSQATADPVFGFDQQAFDEEAARLGLTSVPLDQYFRFDSSAQLKFLPPIPGGNTIPEPSTWVLLIAGGGLLALVTRRRDRTLRRI